MADYTVSSGATVYAGRYPWMPTKLYEWVAIPNTSGAGGASINAYSGLAFKPSTCELISAAAGGHTDSTDNRVVSNALLSDAPSWVQRIAPSSTVSQALNSNSRAYNPDLKPSSRHTYNFIQYIPQTNRVVLAGGYGFFGSAELSRQVDAVNLSDTTPWTWDAEGTNPDVPAGGGYGVCVDSAGLLYTQAGKVWNDSTRTWGSNALTLGRFPHAFDSKRNRIFNLQWGDSQGYGSGVTASVSDISANTTTVITLSGPALDQFISDAAAYAGMTYDSVNDEFVWVAGIVGSEGRFYRIKPNSGTTWVIRLQPVGSGSATLAAAPLGGGFSSGIQQRLFYAPKLRGLVYLPQASSNILFMRTA